jgi:hypothetical protein
MKVKVLIKKEVIEEMDIEFPRYSQHCLYGDDWSTVIYSRLSVNGNFNRISIRNDDQIELEKDWINLGEAIPTPEYYFGLGEYACNELEFEEARKTALKFLETL